ncbi:MAG: sigma 54-interacting transcriptional regulator [Acidobacteriota bacterium]
MTNSSTESPNTTTWTFVLSGTIDGRDLRVELAPGSHRVGSDEESDLRLAERSVSRHHGVLQVTPYGLLVEDRGSTNGTFVDGHRVRRGAIAPGSTVRFGRVELQVEALRGDDTDLALTFALPAGLSSSAIDPPADTTLALADAPHADDDVRAAALDVVRHLVRELANPTAAAGSTSKRLETDSLETDRLEILARCLGGSAALAQWHDDGRGTLRATVGSLGDPPSRHALEQSRPADGPERWAAAFDAGMAGVFESRGDGSVAGLVAWPAETASATLEAISTALEVLSPVLLPTAVDACRQPASAPPALRFPPDYRVATTPAMLAVYDQMRTLLRGDIPVLIRGETGVGKERIARLLHDSSERHAGPFVAVNCAALPADLAEAELFGVERGAATGVSARPGCFRDAAGGTLFLDEVGEMAPSLQAKLLRALQEREVRPVGGRPVPTDVRILSATNLDLDGALDDGRLRPDLYFRLAGYCLNLPPLRSCRDEVPSLCSHFLQRFAAEGGVFVRGLSVRALRCLVAYAWPGNVRELETEMRRLVYSCRSGDAITADALAPRIRAAEAIGTTARRWSPDDGDASEAADGTDWLPTLSTHCDLALQPQLDALESHWIRAALERTDGRRGEAAALLGVSRNGLRKKIRRLGLEP